MSDTGSSDLQSKPKTPNLHFSSLNQNEEKFFNPHPSAKLLEKSSEPVMKKPKISFSEKYLLKNKIGDGQNKSKNFQVQVAPYFLNQIWHTWSRDIVDGRPGAWVQIAGPARKPPAKIDLDYANFDDKPKSEPKLNLPKNASKSPTRVDFP